MKHKRKSQSKSSESVATVAAPEPKDVWTEALTQSNNVIDLAVLESGESTEFSRSCWIAAIRDLAAESPLIPARNEAAAPEAASPWPQAPTVPPAEQVDVLELQRQILEAESQVPQIPCDSTACSNNLAASGNGAELEQVNAREDENRNAADSDLIRGESDWGEIEAAKATASTLKSFLDEATERIKRLSYDLEVLQHDRDQLAVQLKSGQESSAQAAHEAAEVKNRLDGLTLEFEIISAEAAQLRLDRERADSEWNEQLNATRTSAQKLEADGSAAVERLQSELEKACRARAELAARLKSEQESSAQAAHEAAEVKNRLDGLTAEFELINAEAAQLRLDRERADSEWNEQLNATRTSAQKLEADGSAAVERLQSELEKACRAPEELAARLKSEQESSAQAAHEAAEVKNRLDRLTAEFELITAEAAQLRSDRERADSERNEQLDATRTSAQKLEADRTAAVERLESKLEKACRAREELAAQLKSEQESSAQAAHEAAEVKNRLAGLTAEFELISAEAAQLRLDRERADSERNEQLDATRTSAQKLEADRTAAVERLESELERACCARDQLAVQLKSEQESSAQAAHETAEVKNRLDGLTVEFELISAEAAQLRLDRERADSRLKQMVEEVERLSKENAKFKEKGTVPIAPEVLRGDLYTFETAGKVSRASMQPKRSRRSTAKPT